MRDWFKAWLILLLVCIAGCSVTTENVTKTAPPKKPALKLHSHSFKNVEVPDVESIFYLDELQKQRFLQFFNAQEQAHLPKNERLFSYLEQVIDGFHFRGETYSADVAIKKQSGNCLSLAILTTALAKLAGLDIDYQRVNSAPVYHRFHNVMTLSSHVRTYLYYPETPNEEGEVTLVRAKLIVDYFPQGGNVGGHLVKESEFIAMFYQNLAGDALVKGDYDLAFSLLNKGLKISPFNAETLNTMAVLFKQVGDLENAELLFQYAMKHTSGSVNVLSNYATLLRESNRTKIAENLEKQLENIDDDNPYRWYDIADKHFQKSNFLQALRYYKKAIETAPYLHEGYFGLAKTFYQMGRSEEASIAMQKAMELAYVPDEQFLYQAKLRLLSAANDN